MNDLKRSLEKAIEELRDVAPPERRSPPASDSIEAALAYVPSVSPHFRPSEQPPKAPVPVELKIDLPELALPGAAARRLQELHDSFATTVAAAPPSLRSAAEPPAVPRAFEARERLQPPGDLPARPAARGAGGGRPVVPGAASASGQSMTGSRAAVASAPSLPMARQAAPGSLAETRPEVIAAASQTAPSTIIPAAAKSKRKLDRGTVIIIVSCIGGLASGWLGSMLAERIRGGGTVAEQSTDAEASAAFTPIPAGAGGMLAGKADRLAPIDESRCTVLELDRSSGLTLARPCRDIETADVNTTLSKSDLMAQP